MTIESGNSDDRREPEVLVGGKKVHKGHAPELPQDASDLVVESSLCGQDL